MKKVLSVIVLLIVALVVVSNSFTPNANVQPERTESKTLNFQDVGQSDVVPPYGPVHP